MSARAEEWKEEVFTEESERISGADEDLDEALKEAASSASLFPKHGRSRHKIVLDIPEAVDDFLRNFLRRVGLGRTLDSFEAEWYRSGRKNLAETTPLAAGLDFLPDALTHQRLLQCELNTVRRETEQLKQEVLAAGESLVRLQKERDFHQLQNRRLAEDKRRLFEDFKRLKKRLHSYEPALRQLDEQYQGALRQKTLLTLEKDRVQKDARQSEEEKGSTERRPDGWAAGSSRHPNDSDFPVCGRMANLHLAQEKSPGSFSLFCSIKAHELPISCISLHPRKLILASTSDDCGWRLWTLPAAKAKVGQMVLAGEGHSDWLSGCSFHPDGSKLATTSGDATVRLWDFARGRCVLILSGHSQPTWGCCFHACGYFLASCSADKTAKLWDLNSERCRLTLHRHAASVNSVCFMPSTNLLLTCSADKTLALWDIRLGICTATFRGHQHPCNHAAFSLVEEVLASCDSRGVVNLWDVRKPASPTATVDAGPLSANHVAFSPSGRTLAVASNDSLVKMVEMESHAVSNLLGHKDGVQSVTFDHKGEIMMSAGNDGFINVWK